MNYEEKFAQLNQHPICARDYSGEEPTVIRMHAFPDNVHLYDRLVPCLSPPRRVVTFDFLGWGASDKPAGYPYTATNQVRELAAVIKQLLDRVVLVAHDASGPPAIDWALAQPERVAGLVLLNPRLSKIILLDLRKRRHGKDHWVEPLVIPKFCQVEAANSRAAPPHQRLRGRWLVDIGEDRSSASSVLQASLCSLFWAFRFPS
jgi:pimeloyl-ACP methyl ester carboxylesterase